MPAWDTTERRWQATRTRAENRLAHEMSRVKRSVIAAVLACLLLVAGCSASAPASTDAESSAPSAAADTAEASAAASVSAESELDPDNPVTLTLWHYYTGENQQELENAITEFNQTVGRERGVVVESVAMGNIGELEEAVTNSAKGVIHSDEMPDIFSCYADKALELNELGALCDMSAYITQEEQSQYVAGFLADGIIDGKLLTLPIVKSTELLYLNKTALDEFASGSGDTGAETELGTWQSVYDLAKSYYDWTDARTPDQAWDGQGFMGIDEIANFLIIGNKDLGVEILDGVNADVNLNRDVLKRIFDVYYPGYSLGYFDQVGRFCSDDVRTGDLVAYVGSSSGAAYFPTFTEIDNQQVDIELLAAPYPGFQDGESLAVQQGAGMAVAKTESAREEGACLFLQWFTDVPQNVPFAMKTGYLPVRAAAYDSTEFSEALEELGAGGAETQNVEQVYTIALDAVTNGDLYAPTPFDDSYNVRGMLKDTLRTAAEDGKADAQALKDQGMTADEVLAGLDVEAKFGEWLETVKTELDTMGVKFTEA